MKTICIVLFLFFCFAQAQQTGIININLVNGNGYCFVDLVNIQSGQRGWSIGTDDFLVISNKYPAMPLSKKEDGCLAEFPISKIKRFPFNTEISYKTGLWASYVSYDYLDKVYKVLAVSNMSFLKPSTSLMQGLRITQSKNDAYAILSWPEMEHSGKDFVALYDKYPMEDVAFIQDQWQYVRKVSSYMTETKYSGGLWAAYLRKKPDEKYEILGISDMTPIPAKVYRNIKIWATWNAQNKTILNWTPPESVGKNDFIALYEVVADNPNKYIIREWITNGVKSTEGYSYQSKREKGSDSWIAYVSYDYKQDMYIILAKEKIE